MTRTIGIYARLSVTRVEGDSAVETSMGRQVQDCYRHAQQHDWKIAGVYRDEGLSGFKGVHRPEFERMLEDLRAGVIGGVLCWKLDRLCRNHRDFERVWRLCEQTGARVISLHEQFDSSAPDGEPVIRLMLSVARMESQNTSLRLQRYMEAAAQAGKIHGGPRRFGYERDGVTVRADEAEVVREAAQRLLARRFAPVDRGRPELPRDPRRRWQAAVCPQPRSHLEGAKDGRDRRLPRRAGCVRDLGADP